jgi:adenylate cyclase
LKFDHQGMEPKLIVESSSGRRREYELTSVTTIGRHPMQSIQVLDPQVSKAHLVVEMDSANSWVVRDKGSLNGTELNGERLEGSEKLRHRDRIKVGNCMMLFWDPRSVATGDHTVTIGDRVQTSIREAFDQRAAAEFLPVDELEDEGALRRDYEKLRLANMLHNDIALQVRLEELLPQILDSLLTLFKADRGVILLADRPGDELQVRAVKVRGGGLSTDIALSQTMVKQVLEGEKAVLTHDAQQDKRFSAAHSVIISGIRSSMCAPLIGRDRGVFGVIHLDSLYATGQFTERDLSVLQGVAHQAAVGIENAMLVSQIEHEAIMRQNFEKMFSPKIVEQMIEGKLKIEKGGTLKQVAVMFTDIRGFTELARRWPPQEVVKLLNEYFEVIVDVIFDFDGTVDKFIGDSVMAMWGTPVEDEDSVSKALMAAVEIQTALDKFNALRKLDGLTEIKTGIGIDYGEMVVGYMGSSKTLSYTVVGDPVNFASRLCAAAEGHEILISDKAYSLTDRSIGVKSTESIEFKGYDQAIEHWSVQNTWTGTSLNPTGRRTSLNTDRINLEMRAHEEEEMRAREEEE